jgi:malate/lactate dehydrogenase
MTTVGGPNDLGGSVTRFLSLESIRSEKISKAFIPCSWSLLKSIERHRELVNMVGIPVILEAKGLFYIHLLLDWSVEEGALKVHLKQLKRVVTSIGQ